MQNLYKWKVNADRKSVIGTTKENIEVEIEIEEINIGDSIICRSFNEFFKLARLDGNFELFEEVFKDSIVTGKIY